jgi:hypothetical protein
VSSFFLRFPTGCCFCALHYSLFRIFCLWRAPIFFQCAHLKILAVGGMLPSHQPPILLHISQLPFTSAQLPPQLKHTSMGLKFELCDCARRIFLGYSSPAWLFLSLVDCSQCVQTAHCILCLSPEMPTLSRVSGARHRHIVGCAHRLNTQKHARSQWVGCSAILCAFLFRIVYAHASRSHHTDNCERGSDCGSAI